jgi:hypothetical protein
MDKSIEFKKIIAKSDIERFICKSYSWQVSKDYKVYAIKAGYKFGFFETAEEEGSVPKYFFDIAKEMVKGIQNNIKMSEDFDDLSSKVHHVSEEESIDEYKKYIDEYKDFMNDEINKKVIEYTKHTHTHHKNKQLIKKAKKIIKSLHANIADYRVIQFDGGWKRVNNNCDIIDSEGKELRSCPYYRQKRFGEKHMTQDNWEDDGTYSLCTCYNQEVGWKKHIDFRDNCTLFLWLDECVQGLIKKTKTKIKELENAK